jgi:hypothetical protein
MQGVTLIVAVIVSLLAITLRPGYALAAYITSLLWYPSYLVVGIGTIDISIGRIVVGVLLLRCLCDHRIQSKFNWSRLDTWVTLSMVIYVGVPCVTGPLLSTIENRGGFLMDTWFAYMVARFFVTDRATLLAVIKWIAVVLAPLAVLGIIESVTGWRTFIILCRNSPAFAHLMSYEPRWGLIRAVGPFNHSILFGSTFAMFLPLVYFLRHQKNYWRLLAYVLSGVALAGALSSMSMGPWIMVIVVIFCLAMEKYKHWVKPLLIFFLVSCVLVEIVSHRPFYHVIASYANPLGGSGWHRAKLIDCAVEHFGEWWLIGYGDKDPGWGPSLGMAATDVTNEFILNGVRYGILGIVVLCGVLATALRSLFYAHRKAQNPEIQSLCWSLGSILVSVIVTWMSVSFFGQISTLFYCVLGIMGSSFNLVSNTTSHTEQPSHMSEFLKLRHEF